MIGTGRIARRGTNAAILFANQIFVGQVTEDNHIIQPIEAGLIDWDHVQAELGEVILNQQPGRISDADVTLFKSVGVAVQDAFAADNAVKSAVEHGLGQTVEWS